MLHDLCWRPDHATILVLSYLPVSHLVHVHLQVSLPALHYFSPRLFHGISRGRRIHVVFSCSLHLLHLLATYHQLTQKNFFYVSMQKLHCDNVRRTIFTPFFGSNTSSPSTIASSFIEAAIALLSDCQPVPNLDADISTSTTKAAVLRCSPTVTMAHGPPPKTSPTSGNTSRTSGRQSRTASTLTSCLSILPTSSTPPFRPGTLLQRLPPLPTKLDCPSSLPPPKYRRPPA